MPSKSVVLILGALLFPASIAGEVGLRWKSPSVLGALAGSRGVTNNGIVSKLPPLSVQVLVVHQSVALEPSMMLWLIMGILVVTLVHSQANFV